MHKFGVLLLSALLALSIAMPAYAETDELQQKAQEFGEAFGELAQEFGQVAGDVLSDWGDQLKAFSEDPDGYIDQNEFLSAVRDGANQAGQSLKEYWPTLKEAIVGSAETVIDSDMSWNDKKAALKQYAQLAIPYLKQVEFESQREQATGALEMGIALMENALESELDWPRKAELLQSYDDQLRDQLTTWVEEAKDENLTSALAALANAAKAENEEQAKAALAQCRELLQKS